MTMDTGHKLGLMLLYGGLVGYAALLLRILVQVLFREAIERRRRLHWAESNPETASGFAALTGKKRGWANTWLPKHADSNGPALNVNPSGKIGVALPVVKHVIALVLITAAFGWAGIVRAQQSAARTVSTLILKQQLLDIEFKETQLRMRLEELDGLLKPEAIERALAGVGSTRPEELREHRHKLLTIERTGLQEQLDLLEGERGQVEEAIAAKENEVYLKYAPASAAPPSPQPQMQMAIPHLRIASLPLKQLFARFAILIPLAGGPILFLIVARQKYAESRRYSAVKRSRPLTDRWPRASEWPPSNC
jgi:hypothetical protein